MNFIETNWVHLFINRFGRRRFAVGSGVPEGTSEPSGLLQHNRNGRRMRCHRKSAPRNHLDQSRRQRRQRRTRSPTGKNSESHRRDFFQKKINQIHRSNRCRRRAVWCSRRSVPRTTNKKFTRRSTDVWPATRPDPSSHATFTPEPVKHSSLSTRSYFTGISFIRFLDNFSLEFP